MTATDDYLAALNMLEAERQHRVGEIREFMDHDTPREVRDKMADAIARIEQEHNARCRELARLHGRSRS